MVFRASPFFRNTTQRFELGSYGLFGETYLQATSRLKVTLGLRYNHGRKDVSARSILYSGGNNASILVPVGSASITEALGYGALDFDPYTPGNQDYAIGSAGFSRVFDRAVDRIRGYPVANLQVQFNGPADRFYVRAFVQNLTDNAAITGQYVGDQSSGLYTNIFTLEPRRYGAAAGFKF